MYKKILPILIILPLVVALFSFWVGSVHAQQSLATPAPQPGTWVTDSDVTFSGKNAKRSGDLLDWVIRNYQWSYVGGNDNPFIKVWASVRNIMYAMVPLGIIVAAFLIIITRGQNIQYKRFIVRLLIVVALITLSFYLVQFVYQVTDLIQQFFLRKGNAFISSNDLLSVAFDYENFQGLRRFGQEYDEAAFVSLLLVKLTAASYYAMFLVLMIRKIILWFFIILSPIFALLFLFSPLRNTGKIWLGEFLRWTLYGPLFAVLLSGLVVFWQNWTPNAPLHFNGLEILDTTKAEADQTPSPAYKLPCSTKPSEDEVIYPTAINILIGGPCQAVSTTNNVNIPASFIQYVVAILMIWMVILLPFILLKIFLDYLNNFQYADSNLAKYVAATRNSPMVDRFRNGSRVPPPGGPEPSLNTGMAKQLPIGAEKAVLTGANISENISTPFSVGNNQQSGIDSELAKALQQNLNKASHQTEQSVEKGMNRAVDSMTGQLSSAIGQQNSSSQSAGLLNLANLSIPNMSDIAKFEGSLLSHDSASRAEAGKLYEALNRLAGTSSLTTGSERDQYSKVTEKIVQEAQSGNKVAGAIVSASSAMGRMSNGQGGLIPKLMVQNYQAVGKISNVAAIPDLSVDLKLGKLETALKQEQSFGNPIATALLSNVPVIPPNAPTDEKKTKAQAYMNQYEAVAKVTNVTERTDLNEEQKMEMIKQGLDQEAKNGNPLAVSIVGVLALASSQLPDQNTVQQVNLDDYEQVKKTWIENYRNLEVPPDSNNGPRSRKEWLESELNQIPQAVTLMQSSDPNAQKQARQVVSRILPFLLLGGFSKAEIAAYLKAKEEAAKTVMAELQKSDNEAEYVDRAEQKTDMPKAMTLEAADPTQTPAPTPTPVLNTPPSPIDDTDGR